MSLPRVKINFENGALGSSTPSDDGVVGLIASGKEVVNPEVEGEFLLKHGDVYLINKVKDLETLGITDAETDQNISIYRTIKEFYSEAPNGTNLWLMVVPETIKVSEMLNKEKPYAIKLIESAKGAINLLITKKTDVAEYTPVIDSGSALDNDVYIAMSNAQSLCETVTVDMFAPLFVLLEGRYYTGDATKLKNLRSYTNNRVGVLIGDTFADSNGACIGLVAGRVAANPVQRSIARVKSGAIKADNLYIGSLPAENGNPAQIHKMGFITARTYVGKAGYFWTDDTLATQDEDDYALIPRRRVVDKAFRIAYLTLIEELGEEIPVTDEGNIPAAIAKNIQNKVERAIQNRMTIYGNLGNEPGNSNDTGVECYINPEQNIVSTQNLDVELRVKPHGYAKYINVALGFKITNA